MQAAGLTGFGFFLFAPDMPIAPKHEPTSKPMQSFTLIELATNTPPIGFVFEVPEQVKSLCQSSVLFQKARDPILAGILLELRDKQRGRYIAKFKTPGHAKQLIPTLLNK